MDRRSHQETKKMSYENFNKLIEYFRKWQEADLFPIIAVTGPLGQGKSSFSIECAKNYVKRYFNENWFKCKKYIAYDNEEVLEKYYSLDEFSPLIADEAARFAMGEDWNRFENKQLKKLTAQIRPRHLLFFLNLPNFIWLDSKYRDELVSMWVWIPTRGYAVVFMPDNNPSIKDRWHLKELGKYKKRITPFTDIDKVHHLVKNNPCLFDIVKFPKVPEDIYEVYLKIRNEKTFEENEEKFLNQKDIGRIMCYNIRTRWPMILETVNKSPRNYPTHPLIADAFLRHPVTQKPIVTPATIRKWIYDTEQGLPLKIKKRMEEEKLIRDSMPEREVVPEDKLLVPEVSYANNKIDKTDQTKVRRAYVKGDRERYRKANSSN